MKKLLYLGLWSVMTLSLQSCLFNQEDTFSQSSAERSDAAIAQYNKQLIDAPNGWILSFYAGEKHEEGSATMLLKFTEDSVLIATDVNMHNYIENIDLPAGTIVSSLYRLKAEQGPLLSFCTYNLLMHYWSEPTSSNDVDGYAGDFEFILMGSPSEDVINIKGKRRNVKMQLRRMPTDITWKQYINGCTKVRKECETYSTMVGYNADNNFASDIILCNKTIEMKDEAGVIHRESYTYSNDGISLYQPMTVNGVTFSNLTWNSQTHTLTQNDNAQIQLRYERPSYYIPMEYYTSNKWALEYTTMSEKGDESMSDNISFQHLNGDTLLMKNVSIQNLKYNIVCTYNQATGMIEFTTQYMGQVTLNNGKKAYIWLNPWAPSSGSIVLDTQAGLKGETTQIEPRIISFVNNNKVSGVEIEGFMFYAFNTKEMFSTEALGFMKTFNEIRLVQK